VSLLFNEALNNILKHSEASFAKVSLSFDATFIHLRIADDGKGFDPAATAGGNGLELMRKHALRHGGELGVRSKPGEGTVLEATMRIH